MSWINGLTWRKAARADFDAPLRPDHRIAVIGDIHGRDDLLGKLLDRLADERLERLVCVGDYVDRGPASADVLRRLQEIDKVECLMGNHERMMLDFLDDPDKYGPRWLRNGGIQTLASFGLSGVTDQSPVADRAAMRDKLRSTLGETEAWLRRLEFKAQSGNLWIVHGAADPDVAMEEQEEKVLLWGHRAFFRTPREDGQWVAHGHTIFDEPSAEHGRIAVDTGAYETGKLTAAIADPNGSLAFLST